MVISLAIVGKYVIVGLGLQNAVQAHVFEL
jgi:hypothetical protein